MTLTVHGRGSHGRVVVNTALLMGTFDEVRNTDDSQGTRPERGQWAHIAIGDNAARKACDNGWLVNVVHPHAFIDLSAKLENGCFVGPNAVLHVGAQLRRGAIVNSGAIIEHDCVVGPWCHVAPGAVLCGNVCLGEGVFVGANTVVKQGLTIAPWVVVGCGSVVVRDITEPGTYVGNPVRKL